MYISARIIVLASFGISYRYHMATVAFPKRAKRVFANDDERREAVGIGFGASRFTFAKIGIAINYYLESSSDSSSAICSENSGGSDTILF